ncbi:hypothetical protein K3U93_05590 [Mycobacterium malmoense]|uniref:hypothetical protein n=2 Tax=Mycobacterium malmoense TaxID=1780 RepID=UPI000AA0D941|nr:hypothetical protein [Mycobacterium malmoense]QZA18661.1 hypothetical protein K3U93_05590 [Mycobacterium malmoense]
MQQLAAFRPLVTAGAAAVGASLIALTPAVSNNVASDLQRSTVTIQHRAVTLADDVVNPLQTWIDILPTALTNLQEIYKGPWSTLPGSWSTVPFPVTQQLAANGLWYATDYVNHYHEAADNLVGYFTGAGGAYSFPELLQQISADFASRNFAEWSQAIYVAFWFAPIFNVEPLEGILLIPYQMLQDLTNGYYSLVNVGVQNIALYGVLGLPQAAADQFGDSLQAVYDSATAGDPLGVLTNLLNFPGAMTNALINGASVAGAGDPVNGLLTPGQGLLNTIANAVVPGLADAIANPNAQNVVEGGSLRVALEGFLHVLLNGWPSLTGGGEAAASVAGVGDFAAAASAAGVFPVDIASVAPSIAADLSGLAPSVVADLASRLPVEFGTLAANVLTSLF